MKIMQTKTKVCLVLILQIESTLNFYRIAIRNALFFFLSAHRNKYYNIIIVQSNLL